MATIAVKFPIEIFQGATKFVEYKEGVAQAIKSRLITKLGTMFFDRTYGSRLDELIFEPNNLVRRSLAITFIRDALKPETRIEVLNISIEGNAETVNITVFYRLVNSSEQDEIQIQI